MSKIFYFPANDNLDSIKKMKWRDGVFSREQLTDEEFYHHAASLASLISGGQSDRATKRGYTIFIKGGWGVGKTSFTWKLVNALQDQCESPLLVHDESLLPFGNIDESLSLYLQKLAEKLWYELAVDIRKEMRQFILEATSGDEYRTSIGVGSFFQISRSIRPPRLNAIAEITRKLSARKNQEKIILVIDDLDRLKQDEIVIAMRMIEKLRRLPGILVFVPVHMNIINNALSQTLGLRDGVNGFVNKLIDYEVSLRNSLIDLKGAFIDSCASGLSSRERAGINNAEIAWYVLLHCIILSEGDKYWRGDNMDMAQYELANLKSDYINQFTNFLGSYKPGYWVIKDSDTAARLQYNFKRGDPELRLEHLSKLRQKDRVETPIILNNDDIQMDLAGSVEAKLVKPADQIETSPAFLEVFMPWLRDSERELLVSDNYSLRDISSLARIIAAQISSTDDWGDVYDIVGRVYDDFYR